MNTKAKTPVVSNLPPRTIGYSYLLLRLFLGVVLFISLSRCSGGKDEPAPSSEASISKISFTVNDKKYDISFAEETVTVTLPYGTTIPSEVTITTLEHAPKAIPSVQQGGDLTVNDGKATITITAEDQTTTKTYTINFVNLPPSTEASISKISFTVNGKNYDASIAEEEATVNLPYDESIPSEVTITTLEHAPEAEPSVQQGGSLTVSGESATITVTAEDGTTTKTYTINFIPEVRVTFKSSDGMIEISTLDVTKGSKANTPASAEPVPATGKSFGYWATASGIENADYGNHLFDFDNNPINEDITLYAVWQEKPADKAALITLINQVINDQGDTPNLNFIDTGLITDMKELFASTSVFNGDISGWDTSKVTNMSFMFSAASAFNGDIGNWDTSQVTTMDSMFLAASAFNRDIGDWDTSQVTNMKQMFSNAQVFNGDIEDWDTSQVTDMSFMFRSALAFNQDIRNWDTSQVTTMEAMFQNAKAFNEDIGDWDTSQVNDMGDMFYYAYTFNKEIGDWDTSQVTNMAGMFLAASAFNRDIGDWDTSQVTTMFGMFSNASAFNKDIGDWDTSQVTNMYGMFRSALAFNKDISGWNVDNVTNHADIFSGCPIDNEHKPTFPNN